MGDAITSDDALDVRAEQLWRDSLAGEEPEFMWSGQGVRTSSEGRALWRQAAATAP